MKTLDRYLIREILLPFALSLVVLTFVLVLPPILRDAEALIAKGVAWTIVGHVLLLLLPQALGITIPMSLLLGILVGFGRMSADREFVALQACGVSLFRLVRSVLVIATVATAADAYVMIAAIPSANQTFRQITFDVVAGRAESDVKPRVFFDLFPNRMLYVRDVVPGVGWRDVFFADTTRADETTVYLASAGRLLVSRERQTVALELTNGSQHSTRAAKPEEYQGGEFDRVLLTLDPTAVFPKAQVLKGDNEMTIAELQAAAAENLKHGAPISSQLFTIQQKFSIPAGCLVLAVIGLALGASNRKEGRLASFALGIGVIFIYYVLLYSSRAAALGGRLSPSLAPWVVNLLLGVAGVALVMWRARASDRPMRLPGVAFVRELGRRPVGARTAPARWPSLPRPNLLDLYVSKQYLRIFLLGVGSLLGVFYISTFIDMADKLFRGTATTATLLQYFYFVTPQYIYYVIPMAALLAALATVGVMTKNSELIVIRACGISLYRTVAPLVVFSLVASALLFGLQEQVIAASNREADRLNRIIRGYPALNTGAFGRQWVAGRSGDLYHYAFFDPRSNQFTELAIYHFEPSRWGLRSLTRAAHAKLMTQTGPDGTPVELWAATDGWSRAFSETVRGKSVRSRAAYVPFAEKTLSLEPSSYFKSDEPAPEQMTYGELKQYIALLQAGGYNSIPLTVSLERKVAFPFVTLILTLLAVPFAVTTGRRGALYGIGVGIILAITYWITLSVFGAIGAGGLLSPMLAAWAPNLLFAAAAAYLLLTVRT